MNVLQCCISLLFVSHAAHCEFNTMIIIFSIFPMLVRKIACYVLIAYQGHKYFDYLCNNYYFRAKPITTPMGIEKKLSQGLHYGEDKLMYANYNNDCLLCFCEIIHQPLLLNLITG